MRKYVTIIIGILLIAAAAYIAKDLANTEKKRRPKNEKVAPTVFIETVKNESVPVTVLESGRLMAKNRIDIFAEVQGVMEPTGKEFKPGENYRKGETIVSIRNDDYYANLQAQKSNLQNLITSILPDLRLDYPEAYKKWDAYLRNFNMDKPVANLPEPSSDKEKFFVTGRNIYTTYYNTKNMEIILSKYNLRAPYNGILTDALVTPGSLVRPGQKLGEFISPSIYEMEVSVNKSILPSLKVGRKVIVRDTENHSKQWNGKIIRINGKVDRTTQTVKVYIDLSGKELKEGMYLEAIMNGEPIEGSMEIARSLLVDELKVYIVQDSALQLVEVEPVFFNEKTVIVKGLLDGQKIISKNVPGAYSGMEVKIYQGDL
ncbi:MAG: HlyD family efflux transporter periplasmic adaptor subunit [Cyclobacteriaceae bacterium]|nr:HlyD family efflux transporter periplasmic adaptor subunit [Cyclobacteriaceae bacterium]